MAHTIAETSVKGATVTVPDNGNGGIAASLIAPFTSLANRARWIENAIDVTGGDHPLATVAALADLTAVSSPANNDQRIVAGFGLYRFVAGATDTPFSPWIVTHASGRWFHAMHDALADADVGATIATLVDGKLPLDRVTNGTYVLGESEYTTGGPPFSVIEQTLASSYVDSSVTHAIAGVEVGDQVEILANVAFSTSLGGTEVRARLKTIENATGTPVAYTWSATEARTTDEKARQFAFRKIVTVGAAGVFQALVQLQGDGSTAYARLHRPCVIHSRVLRP